MAFTQNIVVVGSGFSGVLTAVHLLRRNLPGRIVLMNRSGVSARGVAYGTRSPAHLLNVPAGRMSAFTDDEDSFLRFVRRRDPSITGGSFVPRQWYGDYLEDVLAAAQSAAKRTKLERVVGEVADLDLYDDWVMVTTAQRQRFAASRVVLALGNYAPADPPLRGSSIFGSPRYVRDPWAPRALEAVDPARPVLLIGTGLTMVDIALALRDRGQSGSMHAVSRRGLLPLSHRSPSLPPAHDHLPPDLETGPATARAYLHSVRRHIRILAEQGVDWREVVGSLRPITPQLWQALSYQERSRFLRHVRPYWEVHRHRMAPAVNAALAQLMDQQALTIHAGRFRSLEGHADGVRVSFERRRGGVETLEAGTVINCTGPSSDLRRSTEPLIAALRDRGLVRPDPLGQGLETASNYAMLDEQGEASSVLFYVGPLLKATYWESTAVPELRLHAARAAQAVARSLTARRTLVRQKVA